MRFVKCMISLGQFYVKCSLSAEGTGIWEKSVLFLSRNKKVMLWATEQVCNVFVPGKREKTGDGG